MGWTGLILTALGTIATIVGSYYTYATYQQGRDTRASADASRHSYRPARRSRWVQINAVITFVALCVLAVGIFLIAQSGGQPTQSAGPNPPGPATSSPSNSIPATDSSWSRQWGPGTLLFTVEIAADLDSVPPNVTGQSANDSLTLLSNLYQDTNGIVSWTGNRSGTATAVACANLISTQGTSSVKPTSGSTYCAKTPQGNIAIITVQRIQTDNSDTMTATTVRATAWTAS
jgi:hypothetical protein